MNWSNLLYPKKIYQALRIESHTLLTVLKHDYPDIMLQFLGGIGDELLLSCVAHELKIRNQALKIWQVSPAAELLKNNPDYSQIFNMNDWQLRYSNLLNRQRMKLRYTEQPVAGEYEIPPKEHILACLCRSVGITGEITIRPYYYQTDNEKESGRLAPRQLCVHSMGAHTHETWMGNKAWFHDRFQKVVDGLLERNNGLRIIQVGVGKDYPLHNVLDLRGKTSLRQTAAILSQSECLIGTQGFLGHLARAVECRSVIVFGGREHSWQTGYSCNENLDSFVECAPCWHWNKCSYDKQCMDMISTEDVLAAVQRVSDRLSERLETDNFTL